MSVTLSDVNNPKILRAMYEAGTSVGLRSGPGIGKSMSVESWPAVLSELYGEEFGYRAELAPSIDAPDARGFMIPSKDDEGRAVAKYTYPAILPSIEYFKKYPRGILFIDEFNQAEALTQKALAPLLLDGMVGEFSIPKGWWVVTASNRTKDKSGVVKPMMHLINRQRWLDIDPDLKGWVYWAQKNGVHPMGIAFAKQRPDILFTDEMPSDPRPFCTPRSFVSAMNYMKQVAGDSMDLPSDVVTQTMVSGDIGEGAASTFFGYIKVAEHLPTIEEIKADPEKCRVPPADRLDAAYAAQQLLIHHANADDIDLLWAYSERLPKELQVSTAKELLEKSGGALVNSKRLGTWVKENRALIMNTI